MARPRKSDGPTVLEIVMWFLANAPEVGVHHDRERRRLLQLFAERYGKLTLSELKAYHVLEFCTRRDGQAKWTSRRHASTIRACLNYCHRVGFIDYNPVPPLRLKMGRCGRDWKDEELQAMLRASPAYFRRFLLMIRFTGMRPGEVRELVWPSIDLERCVITLAKHKTIEKTGKVRKVYLCPVAVKLLRWLWRHRDDVSAFAHKVGSKGPPVPEAALAQPGVAQPWLKYGVSANAWRLRRFRRTQKGPPKYRLSYVREVSNPLQFVFLNGNGNPWTIAALTKRFRYIKDRAELPADCKIHGGRHYFVTHAIASGLDISIVAQLAGHEQISTTLRYTHLADKTSVLLQAVMRATAANGTK